MAEVTNYMNNNNKAEYKRDAGTSFGNLRAWFSDLSGPKKLATVVVGVAGGVGAIVGAINGSVALYEELAGPSSHLQLVDVDFTIAHGGGTQPEGSPQLDIKLINTGEGTAFVKEADIRVEKIWTLEPPYAPAEGGGAGGGGFARISHDYEVVLPTSGDPYTRSESLSQSVEPNEANRFTITLRSRGRQIATDYVFYATLSLVNEDNKRLSIDVLFALPLVKDFFYNRGEDIVVRADLDKPEARKIAAQNKETVEEIEQVGEEVDPVKNDNLRELIRSIAQDK
jgi:hypothetical protein